MRFTMQSFAISEDDGSLSLVKSADIDAANDTAAVDVARAHHETIVPNVGGDFEIIVTALDPGVTEMIRDPNSDPPGAYIPRPPGEISRWRVSHEPDPSVAEVVYAQRETKAAAKAEAVKVAEIRAQCVADLVAAAPSPDVAKVISAVADQVQTAQAQVLQQANQGVLPLISPQPEPVQVAPVQMDVKVQS